MTNENVLLSVFFRLTIDVSILEARLIKVWATIWANLIESDEICCPTNCPLCLTHKDINGWRVQDTGVMPIRRHITSRLTASNFTFFLLFCFNFKFLCQRRSICISYSSAWFWPLRRLIGRALLIHRHRLLDKEEWISNLHNFLSRAFWRRQRVFNVSEYRWPAGF